MEQFKEEKPKSGEERSAIDRIVGAESDGISKKALEIFQNREKLSFEREKTEREVEIIEGILEKFPEFLKEYSIEALPLTRNNIHVADEASLTEEQRSKFGIPEKTGGFYMEGKQGIVAFSSEDDLGFAERVAHESIHANSFVSINATREGTSLRRIGFAATNEEGRRYFNELNEAITEELTKRFAKKYSQEIPALSEVARKRDNFIDEHPDSGDDIMSVVTQRRSDGLWETVIRGYKYPKEREAMSALVEELYEKNKGTFASQEEVFRIFVDAAFSGNLMKCARLIEGTLGKGTFQKLAEK